MIRTEQYQALIFDLGGVIFDLDFSATQNAFSTLFGQEAIDFGKLKQSSVFDDNETGAITESQFCDGIRQLGGKDVSNEAIVHAWNAMLIGPTEKNIQLLERLAKSKPLYLLSNTNYTHLKAVKTIFDNTVGYARFERCFNHLYYSNEIGLRKPNANIFEFVLNENNLNPNTTFFIDDSPQHIAGAKSVGIDAYHLKDGEKIVDLF